MLLVADPVPGRAQQLYRYNVARARWDEAGTLPTASGDSIVKVARLEHKEIGLDSLLLANSAGGRSLRFDWDDASGAFKPRKVPESVTISALDATAPGAFAHHGVQDLSLLRFITDPVQESEVVAVVAAHYWNETGEGMAQNGFVSSSARVYGFGSGGGDAPPGVSPHFISFASDFPAGAGIRVVHTWSMPEMGVQSAPWLAVAADRGGPFNETSPGDELNEPGTYNGPVRLYSMLQMGGRGFVGTSFAFKQELAPPTGAAGARAMDSFAAESVVDAEAGTVAVDQFLVVAFAHTSQQAESGCNDFRGKVAVYKYDPAEEAFASHQVEEAFGVVSISSWRGDDGTLFWAWASAGCGADPAVATSTLTGASAATASHVQVHRWDASLGRSVPHQKLSSIGASGFEPVLVNPGRLQLVLTTLFYASTPDWDPVGAFPPVPPHVAYDTATSSAPAGGLASQALVHGPVVAGRSGSDTVHTDSGLRVSRLALVLPRVDSQSSTVPLLTIGLSTRNAEAPPAFDNSEALSPPAEGLYWDLLLQYTPASGQCVRLFDSRWPAASEGWPGVGPTTSEAFGAVPGSKATNAEGVVAPPILGLQVADLRLSSDTREQWEDRQRARRELESARAPGAVAAGDTNACGYLRCARAWVYAEANSQPTLTAAIDSSGSATHHSALADCEWPPHMAGHEVRPALALRNASAPEHPVVSFAVQSQGTVLSAEPPVAVRVTLPELELPASFSPDERVASSFYPASNPATADEGYLWLPRPPCGSAGFLPATGVLTNLTLPAGTEVLVHGANFGPHAAASVVRSLFLGSSADSELRLGVDGQPLPDADRTPTCADDALELVTDGHTAGTVLRCVLSSAVSAWPSGAESVCPATPVDKRLERRMATLLVAGQSSEVVSIALNDTVPTSAPASSKHGAAQPAAPPTPSSPYVTDVAWPERAAPWSRVTISGFNFFQTDEASGRAVVPVVHFMRAGNTSEVAECLDVSVQGNGRITCLPPLPISAGARRECLKSGIMDCAALPVTVDGRPMDVNVTVGELSSHIHPQLVVWPVAMVEAVQPWRDLDPRGGELVTISSRSLQPSASVWTSRGLAVPPFTRSRPLPVTIGHSLCKLPSRLNDDVYMCQTPAGGGGGVVVRVEVASGFLFNATSRGAPLVPQSAEAAAEAIAGETSSSVGRLLLLTQDQSERRRALQSEHRMASTATFAVRELGHHRRQLQQSGAPALGPRYSMARALVSTTVGVEATPGLGDLIAASDLADVEVEFLPSLVSTSTLSYRAPDSQSFAPERLFLPAEAGSDGNLPSSGPLLDAARAAAESSVTLTIDVVGSGFTTDGVPGMMHGSSPLDIQLVGGGEVPVLLAIGVGNRSPSGAGGSELCGGVRVKNNTLAVCEQLDGKALAAQYALELLEGPVEVPVTLFFGGSGRSSLVQRVASTPMVLVGAPVISEVVPAVAEAGSTVLVVGRGLGWTSEELLGVQLGQQECASAAVQHPGRVVSCVVPASSGDAVRRRRRRALESSVAATSEHSASALEAGGDEVSSSLRLASELDYNELRRSLQTGNGSASGADLQAGQLRVSVYTSGGQTSAPNAAFAYPASLQPELRHLPSGAVQTAPASTDFPFILPLTLEIQETSAANGTTLAGTCFVEVTRASAIAAGEYAPNEPGVASLVGAASAALVNNVATIDALAITAPFQYAIVLRASCRNGAGDQFSVPDDQLVTVQTGGMEVDWSESSKAALVRLQQGEVAPVALPPLNASITLTGIPESQRAEVVSALRCRARVLLGNATAAAAGGNLEDLQLTPVDSSSSDGTETPAFSLSLASAGLGDVVSLSASCYLASRPEEVKVLGVPTASSANASHAIMRVTEVSVQGQGQGAAAGAAAAGGAPVPPPELLLFNTPVAVEAAVTSSTPGLLASAGGFCSVELARIDQLFSAGSSVEACAAVAGDGPATGPGGSVVHSSSNLALSDARSTIDVPSGLATPLMRLEGPAGVWACARVTCHVWSQSVASVAWPVRIGTLTAKWLQQPPPLVLPTSDSVAFPLEPAPVVQLAIAEEPALAIASPGLTCSVAVIGASANAARVDYTIAADAATVGSNATGPVTLEMRDLTVFAELAAGELTLATTCRRAEGDSAPVLQNQARVPRLVAGFDHRPEEQTESQSPMGPWAVTLWAPDEPDILLYDVAVAKNETPSLGQQVLEQARDATSCSASVTFNGTATAELVALAADDIAISLDDALTSDMVDARVFLENNVASAQGGHGQVNGWLASWIDFTITGRRGSVYDVVVDCRLGSEVVPPASASDVAVVDSGRRPQPGALRHQVMLTGCPEGRVPSEGDGFLCEICPSGTYSDGGAASFSCIDCPARGVSCELGILTLTPGYYRPERDYGEPISGSTELHPCFNGEACSVNDTERAYSCVEGYTGPLCGVCEDGFAFFGEACRECWSDTANWSAVGLLVAGALAAAAFLSVRSSQRKSDRSDRSIAIRILLSHMQGLSALTVFAAAGTQTFQSIAGVTDVVSVSPFSWAPVHCALHASFLTRLMATLALPAVMVVLVILAFLLKTYLCIGPDSLCRRCGLVAAPSSQHTTGPSTSPSTPTIRSASRASMTSPPVVLASSQRKAVAPGLHGASAAPTGESASTGGAIAAAVVSGKKPPRRGGAAHDSRSIAVGGDSDDEETDAVAALAVSGSRLAPRVSSESTATQEGEESDDDEGDPTAAEVVYDYFHNHRYLVALSMVVFLAFMPVTGIALTALSCYPDRIAGDLYLEADLSVQCWVGNHVGAALLAVATLGVLTIGFPVMLISMLKKGLRRYCIRHVCRRCCCCCCCCGGRGRGGSEDTADAAASGDGDDRALNPMFAAAGHEASTGPSIRPDKKRRGTLAARARLREQKGDRVFEMLGKSERRPAMARGSITSRFFGEDASSPGLPAPKRKPPKLAENPLARMLASVRFHASSPREFETEAEMTGSNAAIRSLLARFAFLFDGYDTDRGLLWWEAVVLARKAGLVVVASLIKDPASQVAGALFVLGVALWLQERYAPYQRELFNTLEALSLAVLAATATLSLLYLRAISLDVTEGATADLTQDEELADEASPLSIGVTALLLLMNVGVVLFMLWVIIRLATTAAGASRRRTSNKGLRSARSRRGSTLATPVGVTSPSSSPTSHGRVSRPKTASAMRRERAIADKQSRQRKTEVELALMQSRRQLSRQAISAASQD